MLIAIEQDLNSYQFEIIMKIETIKKQKLIEILISIIFLIDVEKNRSAMIA